ncbi:MAG: hypothetical protein AMXMBFR82_13260 [Candidatus Hydrogenedentota bacterium]
MKNPTLQVKMGGKTVTVPVYRDEATTLRIVGRVNQRLGEIEESSPRIDTQAFALQTAYTFAVELARAESEADADEQDCLQALGRLAQALKETLAVIKGKS